MGSYFEYTPWGKKWIACSHAGNIPIEKWGKVTGYKQESMLVKDDGGKLEGCTCKEIIRCIKCGWSTCDTEREMQKKSLQGGRN